jgi:hypothetical protein
MIIFYTYNFFFIYPTFKLNIVKGQLASDEIALDTS